MKETEQLWELVNPEGTIRVEQMMLNQHPQTLEGKTVVLRWNGKHNGDIFLSRVAVRLAEEVKGVRVIKAWEKGPNTAEAITGSQLGSTALAERLAAFKPDLVIGAQGD